MNHGDGYEEWRRWYGAPTTWRAYTYIEVDPQTLHSVERPTTILRVNSPVSVDRIFPNRTSETNQIQASFGSILPNRELWRDVYISGLWHLSASETVAISVKSDTTRDKSLPTSVYDERYGKFCKDQQKPGVFHRLLVEDKKITQQTLTFSKAGDEVTLCNAPLNHEPLKRITLKLQKHQSHPS